MEKIAEKTVSRRKIIFKGIEENKNNEEITQEVLKLHSKADPKKIKIQILGARGFLKKGK